MYDSGSFVTREVPREMISDNAFEELFPHVSAPPAA